MCARERDSFGTDHQEIGFFMAAEWKLPEEYRLAIRLHHEEQTDSPLADLLRTAHLLVTADTEDSELLERKNAIKMAADGIIQLFAA